MIIGNRIYRFKNGKKILLSNVYGTFNIRNFDKPIRKWYRKNPYAKKLDEKWICQDYRIDQQRPQRNVYSEAYLEIKEITEIEKRYLDKLIEELEKDIDYPTVWDDGENWYYEETIYCPDCGKRRKVLTSETHCEFCGFEFSKAKNCPKCNRLNLEDNVFCTECGHDFHKEDVDEKDVEIVHDNSKKIYCSECCHVNVGNNYCTECGHKLRKVINEEIDKKYCQDCGCKVDKNAKYCTECGSRIGISEEFVKCAVCGEWIGRFYEDRYCVNCGHDNKKRSRLLVTNNVTYKDILFGNISDNKRIDLRLSKICPNCNAEHQPYFNYCEDCGTKLIEKNRR